MLLTVKSTSSAFSESLFFPSALSYASLLGFALSPTLTSAHGSSAAVSKSGFTELTALSIADYQWIGDRIYQNECAGKPEYLTHWGKGEGFPSLGIGHFIWHPDRTNNRLENNSKNKPANAGEGRFAETFPAMVSFVAATKKPPAWLEELSKSTTFTAPWQNLEQFERAKKTPELQQLRAWLLSTQSEQAQFIVLGFQQRWADEIQSLPLSQQLTLQSRLKYMMSFKKGLFAVIDYFNFKGIGANHKEQYQGESWGLASVLMAMEVSNNLSQEAYLASFVTAAKQRLQLRVVLAPVERNEARWLKGWETRLEDYLK